MASKHSASSPVRADLSGALCDVLAAVRFPAGIAAIMNVLSLLGREFEAFTRMSEDEVEQLLRLPVAEGRVRHLSDGSYQSQPVSSDDLRAIFAQPRYETLANVIARAMPVIGTQGEANGDKLQRDIENSFFSGDFALLNSTLTTMRDAFPREYQCSNRFNFLLDEPQEWLLNLPENFLMVCAWQLLPAATRDLKPVRALAERLFALHENAKPVALCQMIDYAILCGDWQRVVTLIRKLSAGTPRLTRVAWLRFITGKDDESVSYFIDALDSLRREQRRHDGWFRTIGGVFMLLAELRKGDDAALSTAANHAIAACAEDTDYRQLYQLLEQVIACRRQPDLPPGRVAWTASSPLVNIFCCVAQYWLDGTLNPAQMLLLERSRELAVAGGYQWLAEECTELVTRLKDTTDCLCRRWHASAAGGGMPFMLDCVMTQNSWVERLVRVEHHLNSLPMRASRRLIWVVNVDNADSGLFLVKPVEQHSSKNGRWTRGRKFIGYRTNEYTRVSNESGQCLMPDFEMSAQDKFACDTTRNAELAVKDHPELRRSAWAQVVQSLVGHPRVYLDGADGKPLKCISATPRIRIRKFDDQYQYCMEPSLPEGESLVVRLENGDLLCVYEFDEEKRQLREMIGEEFRVPADSEKENTEIMALMARHYRLISELPLPQLEVPVIAADTTPCVRLVPDSRGMKVQLLVSPFAAGRDFCPPGEGAVEVVYREGEHLRRIVRDHEEEVRRASQLVQSCESLSALEPQEPWCWYVEGMACYEFTMQLREHLDECRVQWPEDQRYVCRRTITLGNVSLNTQNYQSWFSIDGEVKLEDSDATITLGELMQAAVDRKRFIALSDGQMAALSDNLLKRLKELSRTGELGRNKDGSLTLNVCRFLMPFISQTLEGFGGVDRSAECDEWIRKYDEAMQLQPALPEGLNITLRPYQQDGYTWMSRLDAVNAGACLADDMGLGKTVQAISLIISRSADGPCLIVAPTSVCANWQQEFMKYAPGIKCQIFGPGDRKDTFRKLGPGHVLITSYGLLQSEQSSFRNQHWRVAVLDEAQAIKNSHAKRSQAALEIHADFRVVTTGTPVENNLSELWSIFNFIIPGLLGSRESFQKRFATPIENENAKEVSAHLKNLVSPFLLRRRKDQVLSELPPKEEIDYPVTLSEEERRFYDDLRHRILNELEQYDENEGQKHIRVLSGINKLRLAVDHPSLVEGGEGIPGSKLETFMGLLKGVLENGHKVLVFSQFVKFLSVVRESLDTANIAYQYLDGTMSAKERSNAVESFQNGEVPVFLISLRAGGLGLNLTQADYVIHLDSWWNPAVENQASDRAYRLGQNKPVTIYHLRTTDTIEDKVKALHKHKLDLADQLLANTDTIETSSLEELLRLIRE